MNAADQVRGAHAADRRIDAQQLTDRLAALTRFLQAVEGHLPDNVLVAAHTLVERAGGRLGLSQAHTVVALSGSTGSGKSSLFNAIARLKLSSVGVRRPTTGVAHACVWGPLEPAAKLLDWIGVLPRQRFLRESALDGDDEAALHGLILLDLPDFDSVERGHRLEVDRLLGLVDLIIWVVDPQKYGDRVLHDAYLRQFRQHADITVVVLNQADRLSPADAEIVVNDLRRLLDSDGIGGVPVLATSAKQPGMLTELRELLEKAVGERQAALRRLAGDLTAIGDQLAATIGPPAGEDEIDRATVRQLADALAASAGVPAVVDATGRSYRHRSIRNTGWPLLRRLRTRVDPLRRLHLAGPPAETAPGTDAAPVAATSVPPASAAQQSAVGLSVRAVATRAAAPLPAVWGPPLMTAARSRLAELPDALDRAVADTDLGANRTPRWWLAVGMVQWCCTAATLIGFGWLLGGYAIRALGLPALHYPQVGEVPMPTLLLLGGLLLGLLTSLSIKPIINFGARRAQRRAEQRLHTAITDVARAYVVAPVREVLNAYAQAREALTAVRSE
ncbi:MAG TPA: GTPase [Actinoplanes sp.]|nr:GTPase [Actinoplanes sp.]